MAKFEIFEGWQVIVSGFEIGYAHWFLGDWRNLRVKTRIFDEYLVFGPRGYFSSTLASFAELFLRKCFWCCWKWSRGTTFFRFPTIEYKCCVFLCNSIWFLLSIIEATQTRKNFASNAVLLMWEKTISLSEKFLFKRQTEKCWLQRRRENGLPIFARQCVRSMFFTHPLRFRKKSIKKVLFDLQNLGRDLCCAQPVFSIPGNPKKEEKKCNSVALVGRGAKLTRAPACKSFWQRFLARGKV